MTFLIDNLYLIVIALASGGLLLWPLVRKGGASTTLTPLEATQRINHRNAIVVDVRDEKAFALGSLAGARNIPFAALKDRAGELVRFKARPVLIVCETGQQSTRAIADFKAQGFEEAHALAGGLSAWKTAGLPLVIAGRDNTRTTPREGGRKPKGDQRSKSGKGSQRVLPNESVPVPPGEAPLAIAAQPVGGTAVVVEPDAASPSRVKELS